METGQTQRLNDDEFNKNTARVLIVDKLDYATDDPPFLEVETQLGSLQSAITHQHEANATLLHNVQAGGQPEKMSALAAPLAALTAAPAVMSTLTEVAGYFRANYKITGQDFDVKTNALVAAVAGELSKKKVEVRVQNFYSITNSSVLASYKEVRKGALELRKDKERLVDAKERLETAQQFRDQLNSAIQFSDVLIGAIEAFSETITAQADGQSSRLAQAVIREKLRGKPDAGFTHLLWIGNLSSGGATITKERALFEGEWGFLGGTVAAFVLATEDGQIRAADTLVRLGAFPHEITEDFFERDEARLRYILKPKKVPKKEGSAGEPQGSSVEPASPKRRGRIKRFRKGLQRTLLRR